MILGMVIGHVVSTIKHPSYLGKKLLLVCPLNEDKKLSREKTFIAVDHVQAGIGDSVLVLKEGNGVRQILLGNSQEKLPILETIVGIVDEIQYG